MMSSHPHLERTGSEPKKALSAYGLRLALSISAVLVFVSVAVWILLTPGMTEVSKVLGIVSAVLAAVAAIDIVFIVRGIRRGKATARHRG